MFGEDELKNIKIRKSKRDFRITNMGVGFDGKNVFLWKRQKSFPALVLKINPSLKEIDNVKSFKNGETY